MAVFWLGTVPAMLGVITFAGPLIRRLRERLPVVTPLVLVALGVVTLALRWRDAGVQQIAAPHCHDPSMMMHGGGMPGMKMSGVESPR
jgi:sulfite exporter TauE/SafE